MKKKISSLTWLQKTMSIGVLALALGGCASNSEPQKLENTSGYLPNYSLLKPVPNSPEGTQIYTYTAPDVSRADYNGLIVKPVTVYQTATKQGITQQQIAAAKASLNKGIQDLASKNITIVQQPGPGVAVLNVAITGATADQEGFKPWNIIPVSAAIKLATMATDTDSKIPVLVIELKFTDSVTGKLLSEDVTVISGESFRNSAHTPEEFQQLVQKWIQQAWQYTADHPAN